MVIVIGMSTVFEDSWKHFMGNTAPSLKSEKTEQSQSCRGTGNTRQTAVEDVPEASKNCFPRLSNALTSNGNWTTLDKLRSGDMVMVWSFSKQQLEYSPIIMFNHADNQKNGIYLKVQTEERKETLLISPNHLIFTATAGTQRSMIAAQLRIGDQILVCRQMQMVATKVINIESVEEDGLFAPITLAGTIVVDDVLASCYCNVADLELPLGLGKVDGHQLAHVGMSPFRAAYNLGFKSMLDIPKEKDMPDCIKYAVDWILPLVSV